MISGGSKLLVTGCTGFVGSSLVSHLLECGYNVRGSVRDSSLLLNGIEMVSVGDICGATNWGQALEGVQVVVHTAARVHVMKESSCSPLDDYRKVNLDGTINLANQAVKAGVKRFVFLSTIKVNGEMSGHKPFKENIHAVPQDFYALSKYEAEQELLKLSRLTKMEVVIIRPTLVYGPGVKGNFSGLMKLISKNIPLPLANIKNKRSLVSVDNLNNLLVNCISHPAAANEVFLVSDDYDVSTTELVKYISESMGIRPRLFSIPLFLINIVAFCLRKSQFAERLYGSLQVDITKAKKVLGWKPPVKFEDAINNTVKHFLDSHSR